MPVCPRCGTEANEPTKTWSMVGKPSKKGERFKLTLGLFTCPECEKRYQKVVGKEKEGINVKGVVEEIKGIERGLGHTLDDLKEKLEKLKSERSELLEQIEELKRAGEQRATSLEDEVASLREEVEALKEMLGDSE